MSLAEWCLAWLPELAHREKGLSSHTAFIPAALSGHSLAAVPAWEGSAPLCQPHCPGLGCACSSSQHCLALLTSLLEQRLRVPPPRSLGVCRDLQLFSSAEQAFV